jgi:sigma-B regulation protein RsbU (phosphoserine phosphatase)
MNTATDLDLRTQLLDWQRKLETTVAASRTSAHLDHLLQEVNLTLERMETGSYGVCEACQDTMDQEQLIADPLARYCLSCLTTDQLAALQRDLDLAWQIQGELLPKQNVSFCSWEVSRHYEAAGPVSGDFCDVVRLDEGDLFFLLGDVSGKGIAASVLMAHLHAIFRSLVTLGLPMCELVERANRVFCEFTMSTYFATLVCGRANQFGEVEICNAGHCPPLLIRGGEVVKLEATGLPVGLFRYEEYAVAKVQLAPGESLFLYTDGLSEARDISDTEYGTERLTRLLSEHHALPTQSLVGACMEDLVAFRAGTCMTDDLTIMAIKRTS